MSWRKSPGSASARMVPSACRRRGSCDRADDRSVGLLGDRLVSCRAECVAEAVFLAHGARPGRWSSAGALPGRQPGQQFRHGVDDPVDLAAGRRPARALPRREVAVQSVPAPTPARWAIWFIETSSPSAKAWRAASRMRARFSRASERTMSLTLLSGEFSTTVTGDLSTNSRGAPCTTSSSAPPASTSPRSPSAR